MSDKEYIVVPFKPVVKPNDKYAVIADQVHELMNLYLSKGWEYVGIEKIDAEIKGTVFDGISQTAIQVMIFRK